jgi:hypothetical protein
MIKSIHLVIISAILGLSIVLGLTLPKYFLLQTELQHQEFIEALTLRAMLGQKQQPPRTENL